MVVSHVVRGMENLVVDTTAISCVEGAKGKLSYRGIDVSELCAHSTFEETAFLLLFGHLPNHSELDGFSWKLRSMTTLPLRVVRVIQELPNYTPPLYALQCCLAVLGAIDANEESEVTDCLIEKAMRAIALSSIIVATVYRHLKGLPLLLPRTDRTHAENFLYMLQGYVPSQSQARILEKALILQMDHGFNSSTFVARAVASTLTNLYSSVSAAVGALAGPLHGGASFMVSQMLLEARQFGDAPGYVLQTLKKGKKVMGMGHRVYRNNDPRALIFEDMLTQLTSPQEVDSDLIWLRQIEYTVRSVFKKTNKAIYPNVDFWSGSVYKHIGIEPILYPSVFAVSRVVGWLAHILELRQKNRLYRPESLYIGSLDKPYVMIYEREGNAIKTKCPSAPNGTLS